MARKLPAYPRSLAEAIDRGFPLGALGRKPKSKSKFKNVRTTLDGKPFPSGREANRYGELVMLQKIGSVWNLETQVTFPLAVNGVHICDYVADFVYFDKDKGRVVEDSKGARTRLYLIKRALMKAVHDIEILET